MSLPCTNVTDAFTNSTGQNQYPNHCGPEDHLDNLDMMAKSLWRDLLNGVKLRIPMDAAILILEINKKNWNIHICGGFRALTRVYVCCFLNEKGFQNGKMWDPSSKFVWNTYHYGHSAFKRSSTIPRVRHSIHVHTSICCSLFDICRRNLDD